MKQLFKPLLTALLLLCSSVINAHDFEVDGIYYNILSEEDKTVEVTYKGYNYNSYSDEYTGAVVIPVSVKYNEADYGVTSIGNCAFARCIGLTSITIPNSVTSIESSAFWDCSGLTSITIPNSVTSIGSGAFTSCGSLKEIYLEDGTKTLTLGYNSITYNSNIGEGLFYDCPLEKLYLGRNLSYNGGANYGYSPFYNIETLTTVTIGNSVTNIGRSAFRNCTGLTSIIVYTSNTIYDSRQNCNAIIETASNTLIIGCRNTIIPNSVTSIGSGAFYGCSGLTSIEIPNSIISIGSSAFKGCSSLTSIATPNSVTSIGESAFYNCSSLTSIIIPNSVTSIGSGAFTSCGSLKEIYLEDGTKTLTLGYNSITYNSNIGEGLFYDCPLEKLYLGRNLSYNLGANYGYSPFYNIETLNTVTIGNSVTNIGRSAFYNCSCLRNIIIPNSVTSIGDYAFSGCEGLTSITIPNSVTSIGEWAFYNCSNLTSIEIPNSVTSIGEYSFYGCSSLTSIEIPNSVTSIGEYSFYNCSNLKDVINFSNLTFSKGSNNYGYIAYYANNVINAPNGTIVNDFVFCTQNEKNRLAAYLGNEKEITLPENYKGESYYIGDYAFYDCDSITSITIPNSVTSIGNYAFARCKSLTSIEIPNSVTSIGDDAFSDCSSLTSIIIPNSVTSIGNYAFDGCKSLTSIIIPNSVTSIGNYAFDNCSLLKELHLEDGTQTLTLGYNYDSTYNSEGLFYDCPLEKLYLGRNLSYNDESIYGYSPFYNIKTLTTVTIGNSVTSIGSNAFKNCTSLKEVHINDFSAWCKIDFLQWDSNPLYYANNLFLNGNKLFEIIIPDDITEIKRYTFYNCSSITSVTIPNNITSIGESAFYGCEGLKEVINFSNLTFKKGNSDYGYIAYHADKVINAPNATIINDFVFCTQNENNRLAVYLGNEKEITLPENYKGESYYIGDYAFYDCDSITSITIPNSVTSIGNYVFARCKSLTSIEIPNSVTRIGGDAFSYCYSLTSIIIPNSVTNIGDWAFSHCSSLTSVRLPNNVTSIGESAFYNCSSLTSIEIPNSVTSIGSDAFSGCKSLTNIIIPNSVTSIGSSAFKGCSSLTSIAIPNSVTSIGESAFEYCSRLKEVINFSNLTFSKGSYNYGFIAYYANKVINAPNGTIVNDFVFCTQNEKNRLAAYLGNEKEITLPENYKGEDYYIGEYAFSYCDSVTSITIPNSVTSIGSSAFYNCSGLTNIIIPNSVTSIGSSAFKGCSSLTSIAIPNSVTNIGESAFYSCSSLKEVHINDLSAWCKIEFSAKESNPLYHAKNLFLNGNKLFEIIIPDDITEIKRYAFYGCSSLTSITIPNSVTSIGYSAFSGCTNLEKLYLGNSIESIDSYAFGGCNSLLEIYASSKKAIECNENVFSSDAYNNACLFVPIGRKFAYEKTTPWNNFYIVEMEFSDSYQLIYMVDGEVYKSFNLNYGAIIEPVAEPTKEGHTFSGWSEIPRTMPAKTVIVNGSFTPNSYTVTFKVDGAEYKVLSVVYGTAIPTIEAPTKEGHTFSGWSEIPEIMPANDVVVEGSFSINTYNITYKVDGEIYATDSIKFGATIEPIAEPTKKGHTFSGWNEIPETMPANDVVIEGSFSINTYNITYKVDGEIYATDSIKYGATIEPIEAPTKEGYTFSGWSEIPETMPANDVVIEGTFSINTYNITYKVDGEIYATDSIKYGATITPIEEPTKEGHTFSGWSEIPATMPANDIVIEGSFSINGYTVTFMVDGEIYETMTVEYGAEIELPTPPEKEGYIFTGWIDVPATMPAEDIVIEGRFEVDTTGINAVTLDLKKNEVYNLKGQRITESENLTRGIYIVNGRKVLIK